MQLNSEILQACWDNNPDGAGFMFTKNNKLIVSKGFMTYQDFLNAYLPYQTTACVLHFRIGTHGEKTPENTHPFLINKDLGVVHNGIIGKIDCSSNKAMSDTWHFVDKILSPLHKLYPSLWKEEAFKEVIEDYIGFSKLILMDNQNNVIIYGESKGVWNSDCWFSNTTYQARTNSGWFKKKVHPLNNTYTENYQQTNRKQKRKGHTSHFDFKRNDFVLLTIDTPVSNPDYLNEAISENTKVKIEYFSNNSTVGIINPISNKRACVPLWKLDPWEEPLQDLFGKETEQYTNPKIPIEKDPETIPPLQISHKSTNTQFKIGDEIILKENHNHFRIGDIKIIEQVTNHFVLVKESDIRAKTHAIPKHCVTPIAACLISQLH